MFMAWFVCLFLFLLLTGHVLTEAASTDGRPETNAMCQGHKTRGHPAAINADARRNSGQ